jgi:hypothetical protein
VNHFKQAKIGLPYTLQGYRERELSSKLTSFTLSGLQPGETYGIQLKTKVSDNKIAFSKLVRLT